jgi:hypothetical protein
MEFSDIINFLEKLNESEELQTGHHFLIDGNFIYCFLIKSINYYDPYSYYVGFSNPNSQPVPTMTYSYNYEMELVKKIKMTRNKNGNLTNILSPIKELINFCKKLKNQDEIYDTILYEFLKKIPNKDLLECI